MRLASAILVLGIFALAACTTEKTIVVVATPTLVVDVAATPAPPEAAPTTPPQPPPIPSATSIPPPPVQPPPQPLVPQPAVEQQPAVDPRAGCVAAYPDVCIPQGPDLDCGEIAFRRFTVLAPDPMNFDADGDGVGCES
jgi:hypothetical protein